MTDQTEEGRTKGLGELATVPRPPIMENLLAPEVYADSVTFFSLRGRENISLTCSSVRFDSSSMTASGVVIGRLVIPVVGAIDLVNDLHKFLKDNGFMKRESGAN